MTSSVPQQFAYVTSDGNSKLIREAAALYGTREKSGSGDNPTILQWAKEVEAGLGVKLGYTADSIPWCGLFAAICSVRAGWVDQMPKQPLWARNWASFGQKADKPSVGDILVFSRGSSGHVGFYAAEEPGNFFVLGGNQGDAVSIVRVPKSRMIACRRPKWRISQPPGVKPVWMKNGVADLSHNEA